MPNTQAKTKTILIGGKKVKCRALKKKEKCSVQGDVYGSGYLRKPGRIYQQHVNGGFFQVYRPLKSTRKKTPPSNPKKPKKAAVNKIKSVKVWAILDKRVEKILPFGVHYLRRDVFKEIKEDFLGQNLKYLWKHFTAVPVTITLRKTK